MIDAERLVKSCPRIGKRAAQDRTDTLRTMGGCAVCHLDDVVVRKPEVLGVMNHGGVDGCLLPQQLDRGKLFRPIGGREPADAARTADEERCVVCQFRILAETERAAVDDPRLGRRHTVRRGDHETAVDLLQYQPRGFQRKGLCDKCLPAETRAFEHDDVAVTIQAMLILLEQESVFEAVIGSGETHTIQEWVELCFRLAGLDWKRHVHEKPGFVPEYPMLRSQPDVIRSLGWQPRTGFSGLAELMMQS